MERGYVEHIVFTEHWGKGKSIRLIERENGIGPSTLNNWCRIHGIPIKSKAQSIRDNTKYVPKPTGDEHWSKKKPDRHVELCQESSDRMKTHNPMRSVKNRIKCRISQRAAFIKNPTEHEALFASILRSIGADFTMQEIVCTFLVDFLIAGKVVVELDGRGHASRKAKDAIRDKLICDAGFNVMRVAQDGLWDKRRFPETIKPIKLLNVIKKYIPKLNISDIDPSFSHGQYRVVVRKAYTSAEVVY